MSRWHSYPAAIHHGLGLAYYVYEWLVLFGLISGLAAFIARNSPTHLVILTVLSTILIAGGALAGITLSVKRLHFVNPNLSIESLVDTYSVHENGLYLFEKKITVKASNQGVDSFRNRFKWTGTGGMELLLEPSSVGTITTELRDDVWDMLKITFKQSLMRRQQISFTIRFTLHDKDRTAKPVFRKFVDDYYPHGFTMRVLLPRQPKRVFKELYAGARVPIPSERKEMKRRQDLTWLVRRPRIGRRYDIVWEL